MFLATRILFFKDTKRITKTAISFPLSSRLPYSVSTADRGDDCLLLVAWELSHCLPLPRAREHLGPACSFAKEIQLFKKIFLTLHFSCLKKSKTKISLVVGGGERLRKRASIP